MDSGQSTTPNAGASTASTSREYIDDDRLWGNDDRVADIESRTESTGDGPTIHGEFIKAEPLPDGPYDGAEHGG